MRIHLFIPDLRAAKIFFIFVEQKKKFDKLNKFMAYSDVLIHLINAIKLFKSIISFNLTL